LTLDSGSYNQTIDLGNNMTPIVVTYGGTASSLTITGLPYTQSGNTVTINKIFITAGTYSGTITTISSGDCNEITQSIVITVNAPVVTNIGNTSTSGNTNYSTSSSGTATGTTSGNTNSSTSSSGTSSATFSLDVTASNSSDYTLSGTDRNGNVSGSDPSLTFNVGDTINFAVNASGHPFYLKTTAGTGTGNTISGITNNGTTNQTLSWTPTSRGTYYYQCSLHGGMVGSITIQ
jgi:plastocyanin